MSTGPIINSLQIRKDLCSAVLGTDARSRATPFSFSVWQRISRRPHCHGNCPGGSLAFKSVDVRTVRHKEELIPGLPLIGQTLQKIEGYRGGIRPESTHANAKRFFRLGSF